MNPTPHIRLIQAPTPAVPPGHVSEIIVYLKMFMKSQRSALLLLPNWLERSMRSLASKSLVSG